MKRLTSDSAAKPLREPDSAGRRARGGTNLRRKVIALLVSLFALWAFAAYVTVGDGVSLLFANIIWEDIGRPTDALVQALQAERRTSLEFIANSDAAHEYQLAQQRAITDQAIAELERRSDSRAVRWASLPQLDERMEYLRRQLAALPEGRIAIDRRQVDLERGSAYFDATVDAAFVVQRSLTQWFDPESGRRARGLVSLAHAREMLAREDALLSGILTAGGATQSEHAKFGQLVGAQRQLHTEVLVDMPGMTQARLEQFLAGVDYERLQALEHVIMNFPPEQPPVFIETWRAAADLVMEDLRDIEVAASEENAAAARPQVARVIILFVLAGVLGLAAVIASIVVSITTARALVRQLQRLRDAAKDLATTRLPGVVDRLQRGERVDVAAEAPPLEFGDDEIGQVGQAFNTVQETAIRVAVEQAELRRGVRDVFLSLARRSQALLQRQLGLLDAMERRTTDAGALAELFRVDHLSTRMRRNAENLIVLSGATAGRAWRRPVPMLDVLRAALAEIEDYTRVNLVTVAPASLHGRAAADVVHLLAELIENAATFSPPETAVLVGGAVSGRGYIVEITDSGLGMTEQERAAANDQLENPPEFRLSGTARLGLYVVGKLAQRHGIRVWLTPSVYGGTTAMVLLPPELVALEPTASPPPAPATTTATPERVIGRHRVDGRPSAAPAVPLPRAPAPLPTPPPLPARPVPLRSARPAPPLSRSVAPPAPRTPPSPASPSSPASPPSLPPATATSARDMRPEGGAQTSTSGPVALTPAGLPWRARPGSAGSPDSGAAGSPPPSAADATPPAEPGRPRSLDAMQRLMGSYRAGTIRGRSDAASLASPPPLPQQRQDSPPAPPADEGE